MKAWVIVLIFVILVVATFATTALGFYVYKITRRDTPAVVAKQWGSFKSIEPLRRSDDTQAQGVLVSCSADSRVIAELDVSSETLYIYETTLENSSYRQIQSIQFATNVEPTVNANGMLVALISFDYRKYFIYDAHDLTTPPSIIHAPENVEFRLIQFDPLDPAVLLCSSLNIVTRQGCIDIYKNSVIESSVTAQHDEEYFASHFAIQGDYLVASSPAARLAHVFRRSHQTFKFVATIKPNKPMASFYPYRVAVSPDGIWVALSNPTDMAGGIAESGSVSIAYWDGAKFRMGGDITASHPVHGGSFGIQLRAAHASKPAQSYLIISDPVHGYVYRYVTEDTFKLDSTLDMKSTTIATGQYSPNTMRLIAQGGYWESSLSASIIK